MLQHYVSRKLLKVVTFHQVEVKVKKCQKDCFLRREFDENSGVCILILIAPATHVQLAQIVLDCVGQGANAGGSFAVTAAGTLDAISTIPPVLQLDKTL